jgi:cytochrome b
MTGARPSSAAGATAVFDAPTRLIHLALALLGIAAVVSGQFAGDYRNAAHTGFTVHRWIGIGMGAALLARTLWGLAGPRAVRFSQWLPVTRARLSVALQDIVLLGRLQLQERESHEGLAGLVQTVGLLAFLWMAATGAILFAYIEPGARATGWLRAVKELHEGGQAVVLAYLVLHIGAVVVHVLTGRPIWRRMAFGTLRKEAPR